MKLWNGHRWLEYSGESVPDDAIVAMQIAGDGALDPAITVVTEEASVPAVDAMHERYRADLEVTAERPPLEQPKLPTPIATFHFDTSTED